MKFRKKPIEIEAFQWTGGPDQTEIPEWIVDAIKKGVVTFTTRLPPDAKNPVPVVMKIKTLEGEMTAQQGDWIIQGIEGEIYPCKQGIFKETYDKVDLRDFQKSSEK